MGHIKIRSLLLVCLLGFFVPGGPLLHFVGVAILLAVDSVIDCVVKDWWETRKHEPEPEERPKVLVAPSWWRPGKDLRPSRKT